MDPEEVSYLAFEMTIEGPRLAVYLPPAKLDTHGSIELILRGALRRVPLAHLSRGIRVPFPLHDASWMLRTTEEVCEDYLARLSLGRHSLEPERNLFSSTGLGRQIPERATVMLGESVWWVGRTDIRDDKVPPSVIVEHVAEDHGWLVFLITLPESAHEVLAAQVARWLQRRIQPRRARVWIESPFARGRRAGGVPIYAIADGPLVFSADEKVSLQIFSSTGTLLLEAENVTDATLSNEVIGELTIDAEGVRVARLERRKQMPAPMSSVIVQTADGSRSDLVNLQDRIERARAAKVSEFPALLRWGPASLKSRLKHRGALGLSTAIEAELRLSPGCTIDFDKLGYAAWAVDSVQTSHVVAKCLPESKLFRWLASVGTSGKRADRRLTLAPREELKVRFPELRRLSQLNWPIEFAAQVRTAAQVLEGMR